MSYSVEVIKLGLNRRREELGLTVADVARKANVSKTIAHRWFDASHESTMKSLEKCADAMDSHILFTIDEERKTYGWCVLPYEPGVYYSPSGRYTTNQPQPQE